MIVVSDMMGTLTTGSPFLGLVDWVKHNQSKLPEPSPCERLNPLPRWNGDPMDKNQALSLSTSWNWK